MRRERESPFRRGRFLLSMRLRVLAFVLTMAEVAHAGGPAAATWSPASFAGSPTDGAYVASREDGTEMTGAFRTGKMEGSWRRTKGSTLLGSGTFSGGRGTWRSMFPDGKTMAEGRYVSNRPEGAWRFYHPSGNLAAEGSFHGVRAGAWRFYYDVSPPVPIAEGSFEGAAIAGVWRHYDARGQLLAVSRDVTPASWHDTPGGGHLLDVVPGADGVHHWVHQGVVGEDHYRIDLLSDGSEPLYVNEFGYLFDADGHRLEKVDGRWMAGDCHWSQARKNAAHAYDLVTFHGITSPLRWTTDLECEDRTRPIDEARARHVEHMASSIDRVRSPSPPFVEKLALGDPPPDEGDGCARDTFLMAHDLAKVIASYMTWYMEWPHVDGRFEQVLATLPGFSKKPP